MCPTLYKPVVVVYLGKILLRCIFRVHAGILQNKMLSFMGEAWSTKFGALGDSDTSPILSHLSIRCPFN